MSTIKAEKLVCYHCGDKCDNKSIQLNDKLFCCYGCKTVYELLSENNLCEYYDYANNPGIKKTNSSTKKFEILDDEKVRKKLIDFVDEDQTHVSFFLPMMHCSSCIWLLENLPKMDKRIVSSRVNFLKKQISIVFNHNNMALREVAVLLSSFGYEPHLSFDDIEGKMEKKISHTHIYKIGIAGFCFFNIMMMSFPEYFSLEIKDASFLKKYFTYINLILSLPVLFYSASDFFSSAWAALKQRYLNIDAPIALAIAITFIRSIYEVATSTGVGYFDSMSGIVFFMLLGRYFQNKTYDSISFERDYKSYFPIAVTQLINNFEKQVSLSDLKVGARIIIRNAELIPADAILFRGKANIDYSFVTGENQLIEKSIGEIIYAGGKHQGEQIELEVVKEVSQSYLTSLWNNKDFDKQKTEKGNYLDKISKYFSIVVITLAFFAFTYWMFVDSSRAVAALITPLIVACPCALFLSATFTNGNILRLFGRHKFYIKNADVINKLTAIDTIVFDKTGTLTEPILSELKYHGEPLSLLEKQQVKSIANQSTHPYSKLIANYFLDVELIKLSDFEEFPGNGIKAICNCDDIRLGSSSFVSANWDENINSSVICISINNTIKGHFKLKATYKNNLEKLIKKLRLNNYKLEVLSGDNNSEEKNLTTLFGSKRNLYFNQQPQDKLDKIATLKRIGKNVLMLGDGLNDAGALAASNVGIAVSQNINNFYPACDAIVDGNALVKLNSFLNVAKSSIKIIYLSLTISILYNIIGLYFALQGNLSPVIAAILMPISSISIVLFTSIATRISAYKNGIKN